MYQIRFRLGLRPRPHWRSSQHSPRPTSLILTEGRRGGEGGRKEEEKEKGGEEGGEKVKREGRRRGGRVKKDGGKEEEGEDPLDLLLIGIIS